MSIDWDMGCDGGGIIGVGSVAEEDVLGFEEGGGGGAVVAIVECGIEVCCALSKMLSKKCAVTDALDGETGVDVEERD